MVAESHELEAINVPRPCRVSWREMTGDDQVRLCRQCGKQVYHLSNMSRAAASELLQQQVDPVCVRFYCRHDGTIVTRECGPVRRGLLQRIIASVALAFTLLMFPGCLMPTQGSVDVHGGDSLPTNAGSIPDSDFRVPKFDD